MAVLTAQQRIDCAADWQRNFAPGETIAVTKADLKAALDAIDNWVDANAASFNTSIPQPARANLTAAQKARLLLYVVRKRFEGGV